MDGGDTAEAATAAVDPIGGLGLFTAVSTGDEKHGIVGQLYAVAAAMERAKRPGGVAVMKVGS